MPSPAIPSLTKPLPFNNVGAGKQPPLPERRAAHEPRRTRHHAGIRSACLRRKAHPATRRLQQESSRRLARGIPGNVRRRSSRSRNLLGQTGQTSPLVRSSQKSPRLESAPRQMVSRRQAQRLLQLPRPSSGKERQQTSADVGSRRRL